MYASKGELEVGPVICNEQFPRGQKKLTTKIKVKKCPKKGRSSPTMWFIFLSEMTDQYFWISKTKVFTVQQLKYLVKLGFLYNSRLGDWQFREMRFGAVIPFTTLNQSLYVRFSSVRLFVPIILSSFYHLLGLLAFFVYQKDIGGLACRSFHLTIKLLNVEFFIILMNYNRESMGAWWKGIIPWWCISFALSPQRALDKEH